MKMIRKPTLAGAKRIVRKIWYTRKIGENGTRREFIIWNR